MARKARLDAELVRRGMARSRQHAAELITSGAVRVAGQPVTKPASAVDPAVAVTVRESDEQFVSRGGYKLAGALQTFQAAGLEVIGRRCLDAGASAGGFTDVLLQAGAAHVVAVDVGYGQLAWRIRMDPRVVVLERTNVRALTPDQIGGQAALTVADLSFISLRLVLPALVACTEPNGDVIPMVKPQFEVGRDQVGSSGVVRDPTLWAQAVASVARTAASLGWGVAGIVRSPLPGPAGNIEFFLWLRADAPVADAELIARAIGEE